ncbi:hypothetical protein SAMN05444358_101425 [Ruegeria halocynthiae]|uniref:Lipocalin-like domain-containing protein n=1 Tax=Ruegeria halocynthiae TaxID=985054 RepID=A0A1H2SC18_9RHOB|nr:hypothetical protein [Ruegeria halocynthiae]SDW29115.1 hypothetical protein SAMN05444358_101425 [Ruegeria halocynthiae]
MIRKLIQRLSIALALALAAPVSANEGGGFPQIVGTWTGTYLVAFAKSNPNHDKGLLRTEMELEIVKLDGNLITATNRWRRIGDKDWIVEEAMGTFSLADPNSFVLAEAGISGDDVSSGIFQGVYIDDVIMVTYAGPGTGVSFAAQLVRKKADK